jgi:hypothetical protein
MASSIFTVLRAWGSIWDSNNILFVRSHWTWTVQILKSYPVLDQRINLSSKIVTPSGKRISKHGSELAFWKYPTEAWIATSDKSPIYIDLKSETFRRRTSIFREQLFSQLMRSMNIFQRILRKQRRRKFTQTNWRKERKAFSGCEIACNWHCIPPRDAR